MTYTYNWTKEQERELNQLLGRPDNWQELTKKELQKYEQSLHFDKSFDHPLDRNKLSKKNPTVNDKYITLLKVFFAIREECHKGNLGTNSKGELKNLKSIEKFEKVFMLRFTNCRPQFYSFKKAAELTGFTVEDMQNIRAKEDIFSKYSQERKQLQFTELDILVELSHNTTKEKLQTNQENLLMLSQKIPSQVVTNLLNYTNKFIKEYFKYSQPTEGIRFDITDFFNLVEENTKADWEQDIYSATLFDNTEEKAIYRDIFYQDKMMQLKEHYCFRRLFTYENDRTNPTEVEYAQLTTEGKQLPDWFVHFKQNTFQTLKRKEQLVAFFNNYDEKYDANVDYQIEKPTQEAIEIHLLKTYFPKGNK